MSLSDRYNRGGGRIQGLDRYLTEQGDRLGNLWWNQTGISRSKLTKGLYVVSAWAAVQHYVIAREPQILVFSIVALLCYFGAAQSRGGLVEQIQSEVAGLPRNTLAFLRLEILSLGLFFLLTGAGECLAVILTNTPIETSIGQHLLLGMTLTALQAGEYIRRTNPPTRSNGGSGGIGRLIRG